MNLLWLIRFGIVLICLIMFVWRANWTWAIGLLAASLMVALDALRMRELLVDGGFLSWLFGGLIAGGAFALISGLFRPKSIYSTSRSETRIPSVEPGYNQPPSVRLKSVSAENNAVDRKMLFAQIRKRLSPDDIYDLIFDADLNENNIVSPAQDMRETIVRLMDEAERSGQSGRLAMSVERILTPISKESLPRLNRISAETPPHLLRQAIIANYSFSTLDDLCTKIGIDWQEMGSDAKKTRVRRMLRYLQRRNRLPDLFVQLKSTK
ncbi:MAG: hypothetical protein ACPG8W_08440 [Candidatus Promineifilaceae bacterium]